ncbi:hypothetical protein KAR91_19015 [Candidatus Pacearchaeota archaeon]|nr:hypothetical protein [Candidatus Pacearchaeota archaeon]
MLPTPQDVRDELEGFGITTSLLSDAWIQRRINRVILWVESKIAMPVEGTKQFEETYSGTGSALLPLDRRPIISLDKIAYVNAPDISSSISITSILPLLDQGILRSRTNFNESNIVPIFWRGTNNILVTYTAGFATINENIKCGIIYLTAEKVLGIAANRTGGGDLAVKSFSRTYGKRGKYSHYRNELARDGMALIKPFMTGMVGTGG